MALERDCLIRRKEWPSLSAVLQATTILALGHTVLLRTLGNTTEMCIVELEGLATSVLVVLVHLVARNEASMIHLNNEESLSLFSQQLQGVWWKITLERK